jgi:hypothetical protein
MSGPMKPPGQTELDRAATPYRNKPRLPYRRSRVENVKFGM